MFQEDYWVSVPEDNSDGEAASCRSSLRLKLCRTNGHNDCDITQEVIYTVFLNFKAD